MSTTVPVAVLDVLRGEQFADLATTWERAGAVPREDVECLAGHGLLGMTVGTAHHGSDLPLVDVTEVHRLVAAASPSLHSLLVVHAMVCHALRRWAVRETRDAFLPELATGRVLAAFALTETTGGADAGALTTRIDREDDTLRVTGVKRWLSFGQIADAYLVFGLTEGLDSCALVDAGGAVRVEPEPRTAGLRAARLARVAFDGATAPAARVVGRPGTGIPFVATSCLTLGRLASRRVRRASLRPRSTWPSATPPPAPRGTACSGTTSWCAGCSPTPPSPPSPRPTTCGRRHRRSRTARRRRR